MTGRTLSSRGLGVLALALLTGAAYLPALTGDWVWDDALYLTLNPGVAARDGLMRIWLDPQSSPSPYPLVFTTYWIEHRLWGFGTTGYHAVNLVLHVFNSLLVIALLRRVGLRCAGLAGWLFALHPVHVESAAWISERKDVLSVFFWLISAIAWIEFVSRGRRRDYCLALTAFLAAMLSKTVVCTLPVVLLFLPCAGGAIPVKRRLRLLVPFFAVAFVLGAATIWWEKTQTGATAANVGLGFADRFHLAARAPWFYLAKTLWPGPLMGVYPRWTLFAQSSVGAVFILVSALAALAFALCRHRALPALRWGAVFFLVTLSPALGFLDFATMAYSFAADHYQYLASLGLIAGALEGLVLAAARARGYRALARSFAFLMLAASLLGARQRAAAFESSEAFFRDTLGKNSSAWVAWTNVGAALARRGEPTEALRHFEEALRRNPNDAETMHKLAQTLAGMENFGRSVRVLQDCLEIAPAYAEARSTFGAVLLRQGRAAEASAEFERAAADGPRLAEPRYYLGALALQAGDAAGAVPHLESAIRLNPVLPEAWFNLGLAFRALGRDDDADRAFGEAVRLRPELRAAVPSRPSP